MVDADGTKVYRRAVRKRGGGGGGRRCSRRGLWEGGGRDG